MGGGAGLRARGLHAAVGRSCQAPALGHRASLAHVRLGKHELALEFRAARLKLAGLRERAELLEGDGGRLGAALAIQHDLRRELEKLLRQAEQTDPFAEPYLTRTTADQIVVVYAALGEWHKAMDWVERAYDRRPVRLRRLLTEPLFDRRGLAVDPRYARLLRMAVMEELM